MAYGISRSAGEIFQRIRKKSGFWLPEQAVCVEESMLNGTFREKTTHPSIALFTLHKAGSTFLSQRLAKILIHQGYVVSDVDLFFYQKGEPSKMVEIARDERTCRYMFSRKGVFHNAIRWPINPDWLSETKILLVTRDPRDILTSMYYSWKYSHSIKCQSQMEERKKLERWTVDQFVVDGNKLDGLVRRLETYALYIKISLVHHESYENIVTQPVLTEERIARFLCLPPKREKIFAEQDFQINAEDVMSHKRQVMPGDHARKLAPETIRYCNAKIRHLAPIYGWANVD